MHLVACFHSNHIFFCIWDVTMEMLASSSSIYFHENLECFDVGVFQWIFKNQEQILERVKQALKTCGFKIGMKISVRKCHCDCSLFIHLSCDPFHHIYKQKRKVIWRMCEQAFIGGFSMAFILFNLHTCNSFSHATEKNFIPMFGSTLFFSLAIFGYYLFIVFFFFSVVCALSVWNCHCQRKTSSFNFIFDKNVLTTLLLNAINVVTYSSVWKNAQTIEQCLRPHSSFDFGRYMSFIMLHIYQTICKSADSTISTSEWIKKNQ